MNVTYQNTGRSKVRILDGPPHPTVFEHPKKGSKQLGFFLLKIHIECKDVFFYISI